MDARLQQMLSDTAKLDRMQFRESQKNERERQLVALKNAAMPMVMPTMRRVMDAKCGKCNVDKKTFTKHEDFYLEPINALTMEVDTKGWKEWAKITAFRKFLAMSMNALVFHPAQIKMLKSLQTEKVPMMFVISSENFEVDAMLVNFVLWMNKVEIPLAFVSKKMREIPVIGEILDDFNSKVQEDVKEVQNQLITLESFEKGLTGGENSQKLPHDVHLLPITINYEKLSSNSSLKWRSSEKFGIVKLNFHEPYTIDDILKTNRIDDLSLAQTKSIIDHIKYDVAMKRPVMATNVVAFLLMTEFRDGSTVFDLARKLDKIRADLHNIDFGFEGDAIDVVNHAIKIFGENLDKNLKPKNFEHLSSYAEVLTPHFALESVLVIAAQSLKRSEKFIDYDALISTATDLCELLQFNIPLTKPCESFELQLSFAFDRCSVRGIMSKPQTEPMTDNERAARRMAKHYESDTEDEFSDDGYQSRNPSNEVTLHDEMERELTSLKNVTMPILEAYLTVACSLKKIIGCRVTIDVFLSASMKAMSEECEDGNCKFWESCNTLWMKNCFDCLQLWQMIEVKNNKIALSSSYDNKKAIKNLINRIERFFDFSAN